VGGTHPALIEAMAAGNLCLVLDTPENREVAGPHAWYFGDEEQLVDLLRRVVELQPRQLARIRRATRDRAVELFSWSQVTAAYLSLLNPA
jgi:glycosyltransferase involved in cell wall biosynthesis